MNILFWQSGFCKYFIYMANDALGGYFDGVGLKRQVVWTEA